MQEKRSSKTIVLVAGLGAAALVAAWVGMRAISPDPTAGSEPVAGRRPLEAPGVKKYDPELVGELRRTAQARMNKRKTKPLELPEHLKPKAPLVPPGPDTRWDAWLLTMLGKAAGDTTKQDDVLGKDHPRVDLHGAGRLWVGADVDLDRDGQWDERWSLLGGVVRRRVSPQDDGSYPRELSLVAGAWTLAPGTPVKEATKAP